jgi:hypothetical protein
LFLEIKNQITSGDMTPANIRLIHLIRRTIAPMAVAKAAPFLSISEGMDRREIAIKQHQAKIQDLVNRCNSDAQKSLDKLKKHINDNIADYPLYQSSRCYAAAQARLKGFGVNVVTDLGKSAFIYKKR